MIRNTERRPRTLGDIGIRFVILTLAALLLMALQFTGQLQVLRSAISFVTAPAQLSATSATRTVTDAIQFLLELGSLRRRLNELEQINAALLAENFSLREVEHENAEMRSLLQFAQTRPGLELRGAQIVARVIGQESTNFLDYIEIDLGARHNIAVGMPVVTEQGLVGRISEVNDATSKVLLITDPSSAVNAILQNSRLNGVIRGAPNGDLLMDFIPQGPVFRVGEVVLTSGIGIRFPKGIPIGQVIERRQRDIDIFQQAVVRPSIDFSSLELVAIVTNFDPLEDVPALMIEPTAVPTATSDPNAPANATSGEASSDETAPPSVPGTDEGSAGETATDATLVATPPATSGVTTP
ncbi:MAG: rod shape-determining protein MreC [Caldilineaceae bacterium]|nr:rod shape-determining protein MreC [Caldilineaceae bacterium]